MKVTPLIPIYGRGADNTIERLKFYRKKYKGQPFYKCKCLDCKEQLRIIQVEKLKIN